MKLRDVNTVAPFAFVSLMLLTFAPTLTWKLLWMNAAELSIRLYHKVSVLSMMALEIGVVLAIILLISYNIYLLDKFIQRKVL